MNEGRLPCRRLADSFSCGEVASLRFLLFDLHGHALSVDWCSLLRHPNCQPFFLYLASSFFNLLISFWYFFTWALRYFCTHSRAITHHPHHSPDGCRQTTNLVVVKLLLQDRVPAQQCHRTLLGLLLHRSHVVTLVTRAHHIGPHTHQLGHERSFLNRTSRHLSTTG